MFALIKLRHKNSAKKVCRLLSFAKRHTLKIEGVLHNLKCLIKLKNRLKYDFGTTPQVTTRTLLARLNPTYFFYKLWSYFTVNKTIHNYFLYDIRPF